MIFTGDCAGLGLSARANLQVLFRQWHKGPVFSIQTVGRIMRMPEPDRHYENDILNHAYVYAVLRRHRYCRRCGQGNISLSLKANG